MSATLRNTNKVFIAGAAVAAIGLLTISTPTNAGIIGGDFRSTAAISVNGIVGGDRTVMARYPIAVVGPVERVDLKARTVTVLGQTFAATSIRSLKAARVGDYVLAGGSISGSQLVLGELQSLGATYVAGASGIYVRSVVSSIDAATGRLRLGGVVVDYTATLANGGTNLPAVGSVVEFYGTQPSRGGVALASDLAWESSTQGIVGGDASVNGIVGGDASVNGIVGGDTSVNGIVGGDTSVNGIVGGDTSVNGIVGGDTSVNGIVGGDTSVNGIVGGDTSVNGIVGGDTSVNGIVGGDLQAKGIIGGDLQAKGIIGGDTSVNGIVGGDVAVNGIVGGDMAVNGIIGGDAKRR